MPSQAPHPLEAKFIKLALVHRVVTLEQVRKCQELLAQQVGTYPNASLEQVLQEQGLLTEDECERIWEGIARTGDTEVRSQVQDRLGTRPGDVPAAQDTKVNAKHDDSTPPKRIGGYEIIEQIGRGGMGRVYRARQIALDRDVALKLLPSDLAANAKYIRRFIREARAAGLINHGNLVHVHDVGEADNRYYIVMEYVEGRTVKQIMRREGRIGIIETLRVAEQVCAALGCAHQNKIVHRDIKPDNIMITPHGAVKLCDLGLAKVMEGGTLQDTDTQEGHAMGTPHYMSPEQARYSGKVDARADVYALGATMYHMLTGKVPFDGETPIEVLMRVANEPPVSPDRYEPLLPPPLTRLIMRMLMKDPHDRPQSAEETRRELQRLRRDIEQGRVFVFDDIPLGSKFGNPCEVPPQPKAAWQRWAVGLTAALGFLLLSVIISLLKRPPGRAPAPEFQALMNTESCAPTEARTQNETQAAVTPVPHPVPENSKARYSGPLGQQTRAHWERRLAHDPSAWRSALSFLESLHADDLASLPGNEQAAWAGFKAKVLVERDAVAGRAFAQLMVGSEALAKAGLFRKAAALLDDLRPEYAYVPGMLEKIKVEQLKLAERTKADGLQRAAQVDALGKAGLPKLAQREVDLWARELTEDGVVQDAPIQVLQDAREALKRYAAQAQAEYETFEADLLAGRNALSRIRKLSAKHDPVGALDLAKHIYNHASHEYERLACVFEMERLGRVRTLYDRLAKEISEHPGRYKETDFRTSDKVSGQIFSMEADHFVIFTSEKKGLQAKVSLATISRAEMGTLIQKAFATPLNQPLVTEQLAYGLEDLEDSAVRVSLVARAVKDESAKALLDKVMAYEAPLRKAEARKLLLRAQEQLVSARIEDAQHSVAAASALLSGANENVLEVRAQLLLTLAAAARAQASLFSGTALPLQRGRMLLHTEPILLSPSVGGEWSWTGPAPAIRDNALTFSPFTSVGTPHWHLGAPARVVIHVSAEARTLGKFILALKPHGETERFAVLVHADGERLTAAEEHPGGPAPAWSTATLEAGRVQRLWVLLEVGRIRWGLGDRELGQRTGAPAEHWGLTLEASGGVRVHGLTVEGRLTPAQGIEDRERLGQAALEKSLKLGGDDRTRKLRELFQDYGALPSLASRICAELASIMAAEGREAERRYWEFRALYECPASLCPASSRLLLTDHRLWQQERDQFGPPAGDLLRQGRLDHFVKPSLMHRDPAHKDDNFGPRVDLSNDGAAPKEQNAEVLDRRLDGKTDKVQDNPFVLRPNVLSEPLKP